MPRGTPNPEFGQRLVLLLKEKNMSLTDLARESKLGRTTIDKYVRFGRGPEWDNAVRLAKYFKVTVDWLLTGEGPRPRQEGVGGVGSAPAPHPPTECISLNYLSPRVRSGVQFIVGTLQRLPQGEEQEEACNDLVRLLLTRSSQDYRPGPPVGRPAAVHEESGCAPPRGPRGDEEP
ncbi:MAG: helix-turn-helix domain-containing protein [Pseudomonadota bacterium]